MSTRINADGSITVGIIEDEEKPETPKEVKAEKKPGRKPKSSK